MKTKTGDLINYQGMKYRVSGLIPNNHETHVYFIIRCYFKFPELNLSFETHGSAFMQAIEHRLYPITNPKKNAQIELELFTMFLSVWAVVGVPKDDLEQVRQLARDMRLETQEGLPPVFGSDFPMADEGNLWTISRDLKKCTLLTKK